MEKVQIHDHSLTLLRKLITFTCDACGKEGKDTPYLCLTCAFCVHPICASLHRTVKHVRHQHTLNLTYSLQIQPDHQICLLCVEKVDTNYGFYYCSSCTFVAHLSCAADGEIEDNINVLEDEDKESTEPITALRYGNPESVGSVAYVVKKKIMGEEGIEITTEIKHFSHQHELTLTHELKNSNKCDGCERPILTPCYNCTQCRFVLHKFCAELPRKKWHPLHQHLLTLSMNQYGIASFSCNACARSYHGFSYYCHKCNFDLDVNCSLTSDRLTHDSHEHRRLILSNATRSGKCSVCDSEGYVFRCADCAFALDFKCATLPSSTKYEQHEHPFTLQYTIEDDSREYYCDICEEKRHPKHWATRVQHTVESNKQRCSEHQGRLQGARQSGIKNQDELHVASVRSSSDQVVLIEAEWGSTEARDMVEAVPYLDQLIHSVQEVMPRGLGG
ncbi:uncharacterized protein LOC111994136 [Quercus suber]|uniref:uncharacterized protein LOC111994136 n=1 Tax=Quercus suber TaxID=58331 RepID=UPI0032E00778